ncbi:MULTISPECIES: DUF1186 domain-containing protein [Methylobacterium]|uniref:DUF1186 domain-containing protein n=1 Tax=Methylobacterium thuringiense TaxID=1003091 RepID=A0ABQ4TF01_9HYPH|nr:MULTISPECIES: DUF1186 domain-containing protein [Methylobacterium]TXN22930.1 DUF1186 domain-containing protein [Methylobacterium sp. WL9]GJE53953.1 hypothetical protein EKPJFOCH_0423 [Methylobacterium thuringiense]
MDDALVSLLSKANFLPADALRRAVAAPDTVDDEVLRLLDLAAEDPEAPSDEEANLLFWGLHALAAARDTRVFAPLLRLLRHDDETLDSLLGDAVSETMPLALASAFDGDVAALHRFLLDSTIDDFARNAAFNALAFLTREGRLDREGTRALLERFDDAQVAVEESPGWFGWEQTIAYLGLTELVPRVEAARKDGRITDEFSDLAWFRKAFRQATKQPPDYETFAGEKFGYLDDPAAALAWTAESAGQPIKNPFKEVGRNDPCPCGSGKKYKKCCLDGSALKEPPPLLPGLH